MVLPFYFCLLSRTPTAVAPTNPIAPITPKFAGSDRPRQRGGRQPVVAGHLKTIGDNQPFNNRPVILPKAPDILRIIPLGGLGEIGKNMMVYEYNNDIIVVDCGIMFPGAEMLGVDFVIPDIKYLTDNKERLRGIILTHGHEDHVGGLPYIWPKLGVNMYASDLTAGLIKVKMKEFAIENPPLKIIKEGEKLQLGEFKLEFFRVNHSIPDGLGLAIETPDGQLFIHTGDFKFDHTPVNEGQMDLGQLALYGKRGVTCLMSDSTNAEVEGYTISEQVVGETFDRIFKNARGRIVVTSFASLINRIQQIFNSAVKYHRKVAVSGRSMENNITTAVELGFLKLPEGTLVELNKIGRLPDNEVVIICTGSQGEEFSALVRMAAGEHRQIKIRRGDTVVISASPIPGNEKSIYDTIDNLFREGAQVIYGKQVDIHVSGHASQEELKTMLGLIKPKYFLPIHGEYRHLVRHGRLAESVGIESDKALITENGSVAEFDKNGNGKLTNYHVPSGYILVDGLGIGDVGNIVLRDRQAMAQEGIFVVILTVDKKKGTILTSPDIISRGFIYMRQREDLVYQSRQEVKRIFDHLNRQYPANWDYIKKTLREEIGNFL
ncbi:MAG: RNA-metabolising metallo-beta-lactamase, partial [Candidatus Berkelbacteria bacterium Licking1014_2]